MMQNIFKDKLILVESGEAQCEPLHCYGFGRRGFYLLHYVISGKGVLETDNRRYELSAGQSFIIYPYQNVRYIADESDPWRYTWVNFSGDIADTYIKKTTFAIDSPIAERVDTDELLTAYRNVVKSYFAFEEGLAVSYLMVLLSIYVKYYSSSKESSASVIGIVKAYVDANLHHPTLSVEEIAEYVDMDRSELYRKFVKETGVGVKNYITTRRMSLARTMLTHGCSVKDAAYSTGFSDPLYFSKAFRKYYGRTPSEIKNRAKKTKTEQEIGHDMQ